MAGTKVAGAITLKGSTEIVTEFFYFGINSILYQRGLYPPETFTREQKYGLTMLITTNEELNSYLKLILKQIKDWLHSMTLEKLVIVIKSVDSNEVLERWQFDIECDRTDEKNNNNKSNPKHRSEKEIQEEIRAVIRQITATVTFLPLLESACVFDLLVYTKKDTEVPEKWGETGPQFIANSSEVRLRSFTTTIHKVDTMVTYKSD